VAIFDPVDTERDANRAAVALAVARYRQTLSKFVRGEASRLSYVDREVSRCAHECAEAEAADPEYVEARLREVIADSITKPYPLRKPDFVGPEADDPAAVAVTDPESVDVGGGTSEIKNETGDPYPVERSDIRDNEAVLESIEPDGRIDLSDTTAPSAKHTAIDPAQQVPDLSPGDVIAAYQDGTIVLDDGITTWNMERARQFAAVHGWSDQGVSEEMRDFGRGAKTAKGKGHKDGCGCPVCTGESRFKKKEDDGESKTDEIEVTEPTAPEITSCFRCEEEEAEEGSAVCAKCASVLSYMPLNTVVCPKCGSTMQPSMTASGPTQNQYTCPNCGTSIQVAPGQDQTPGAQPGAQPGAAPAPGAYARVKTAEPSGPGGDYDDAQAQSPAEEAPHEEQKLPPAARPDAGADEHTPSGVFDTIVQNMANVQAATTWSTPGDQDIQQIAQEYGLDEQEVRQNLKIVSNFGDAIAVNGEPHADTDVAGYVELDNFGGRIPTTEEEVQTDNAVTAAADQLKMDPESVYGQLKESYGSDLGGQYYVSVGGEAHYYLPAELVHSGRGRGLDQPSETPQPVPAEPPAQPVSSFRSLAEFIAWDKQRQAERLATLAV
jgi:hypothetical protein